MSNSWDTVLDTDGDKTADPIFYMVGSSLSSWEYVEGIVARLFGAVVGLGGHNVIVAQRALGKVGNSKGRAEIVQEAINTAFLFKPQDAEMTKLKSDLTAYLSLIGAFSTRRNEIAHGAVTEFMEGLPYKGYFHCAASYNTNKFKTPNPLAPSYRFNSQTIARFGAEFAKLHETGTHLLMRTYKVFGPI